MVDAGRDGAFLIPWDETMIDGVARAPVEMLVTGAEWRWSGAAVALEPRGPRRQADLRARAARGAARLSGRPALAGALAELMAVPGAAQAAAPESDDEAWEEPGGFTLTDGRGSWRLTLIEARGAAPAVTARTLPPAGRELWVARVDRRAPASGAATGKAAVICFTPGTRIATPAGPVAVEDLAEGDRVLTRDDGPQEILWTGRRRITGARMQAMPEFRPVRIRAAALAEGEPDADLIVSPRHRVLWRGPAAQALFGTPEVLVTAEDLVNDGTVRVERGLREVTYVHLCLARHQVVWANGIATETFHPGAAVLDTVEPGALSRLFERFPAVAEDPAAYGAMARRTLAPWEAALLAREMPGWRRA